MSKITAMYIRLSMEDEDVSLNQNRGRWHMEQGEAENAYKLFGEDPQIAFVDKPISDVLYVEFSLESEPDEASVLIGIAVERSDYYVDDYCGFWGYVLSDAKIVSEYNTKNYGKRCKMGDRVGIVMNSFH